MTDRPKLWRGRGPRVFGLFVTAMAMSALFATSAFAVVNDGGVVDIQVATDEECLTDTTNLNAIVTFLGADDPCGRTSVRPARACSIRSLKSRPTDRKKG